ncbi:MAG: hypothetical protein SFW36_23475 [Leptolyngbyaceae cyanobacterium bins.59]|nr:hypothetical protein [Leptolyngbyaceae cyanobacterium bins.59]
MTSVRNARSNGSSRPPQNAPVPTGSSQVGRSKTLDYVQDKLDRFLNSLGEVLNDITALEVNTMVVSEISGHKFNPEDAYQALYCIPLDVNDPYFDEHTLDPGIRERFVKLRHKLQDAYNEYLASAPESEQFPELPDPDSTLDETRLHRLLEDSQFLRSLRKLRELRHLISGDEAASDNIIDIISSQTIIQIDGDIINRFDQRLLQDPNREFLLNVHREAVLNGEAQWRGLLKFMVDLMQDIVIRRRNEATVTLPHENISAQE